MITNHLDVGKRSLDLYSKKLNNSMVIGELHGKISLDCMKRFCETYDLKSLIKVPKC